MIASLSPGMPKLALSRLTIYDHVKKVLQHLDAGHIATTEGLTGWLTFSSPSQKLMSSKSSSRCLQCSFKMSVYSEPSLIASGTSFSGCIRRALAIRAAAEASLTRLIRPPLCGVPKKARPELCYMSLVSYQAVRVLHTYVASEIDVYLLLLNELTIA